MCEVCSFEYMLGLQEDVLSKLDVVKRAKKREEFELKFNRTVEMINTLGEPAKNFIILDSMQLEFDAEEYHLAIKSGVPGRSPFYKPKKKPLNGKVNGKEIYNLYSYDLRKGIDGSKILPNGRTRDFCKELIQADRVYSYEEIARMSNAFGTDPFKFAGGWYTDPKTGERFPYCRHAFYLNIVKKK